MGPSAQQSPNFLYRLYNKLTKKNYWKKYKLNLYKVRHKINLDPHPTFPGIKLDPKLSFKAHLEAVELKINPKTNLMKTIKI